MLQARVPVVILQGGVHYLLCKWPDILMASAGQDTNIGLI
jgi:hypothetical protein